MKKMIRTALITSLTLTCLTSLQAQETKFLPIMSEGFCGHYGIALMGGYGQGKTQGAEGSIRYGIEASLACPIFQLSAGDIKQKISIVYGEDNGLTTTELEMAPAFIFDVTNTTKIGVGPVLGVNFASIDLAGTAKSDIVFGAGAAINFKYDVSEKMFIAADARYIWTGEANFDNNVKEKLSNFRSMLKVGMYF